MNFKDELLKLGEEIKMLFSDLKQEQKFADYKLEDGTIIRTDNGTLEPGAKVLAITEDGEVPLMDGEYMIPGESETLKIEVEGGYITSKEVVQPEGEVVPPAAAEAENKDVADFDTKLAAMEAKFGEMVNQAIEAKFSEFMAAYESDKSKFNEGLTGITSKFEQSAKVINLLNDLVNKMAESTPAPTHQPFAAQKKAKDFDLNAWRKEMGIL